MIWVKIEDFSKLEKIKTKYPSSIEVLDEKDVKKALLEKKDVISPFSPKDFGFENYGVFNLIEDNSIPNEVISQKLLDKYLKERLSLRVIYPKVTFNDLAGAKKLKKDVEYFSKLEKYNIAIGGIFLFGIPGAGKSYFAECFAGETHRTLIDLDLTKIAFDKNPSDSLNRIVDFLLNKKERCVLWIDEIEKMIDPNNPKAMQVFGRLLTILNDISKENIKELVFIVTANKIENIRENNPEFLRKGRFRKLYFLNFPSYESAKEIFNLYINKNLKKIKMFLTNDKYLKVKNLWDKFIFDLNNYLKYIDNFFYEEKIAKDTFIYSPAEIKTFSEELFFKVLFELEKYNFNISVIDFQKEILKVLEEVVPLQLSMKEGTYSMLSQTLSYQKNLDFKVFEIVS